MDTEAAVSNHPDTFGSADAWYTHAGPDDDVVLSTRIRLARNLANFPFPLKSSRDERDRIQALVFDAFSYFNNISLLRVNKEDEFAPIKDFNGPHNPEIAAEKYKKLIIDKK